MPPPTGSNDACWWSCRSLRPMEQKEPSAPNMAFKEDYLEAIQTLKANAASWLMGPESPRQRRLQRVFTVISDPNEISNHLKRGCIYSQAAIKTHNDLNGIGAHLPVLPAFKWCQKQQVSIFLIQRDNSAALEMMSLAETATMNLCMRYDFKRGYSKPLRQVGWFIMTPCLRISFRCCPHWPFFTRNFIRDITAKYVWVIYGFRIFERWRDS